MILCFPSLHIDPTVITNNLLSNIALYQSIKHWTIIQLKNHRRRAQYRADFSSGVYHISCRATLKRPSFIQRYFGTLLGNPHEIAETLPAAGLQEKYSKLILKSRVWRDWFLTIFSSCQTVRTNFKREYCIIRMQVSKLLFLLPLIYKILLFHLITSDRCQVLRAQLNKQCLQHKPQKRAHFSSNEKTEIRT